LIGAVVLAAGLSKRMGRPKMILPWGDISVIGQVVTVLLEANIDEVIVVTGGAREDVENALYGFPVQKIFNPDFANGEMIRSLQVGISALKENVEATLVALGDQPQIESIVVKKVLTAYIRDAKPLVVPSYQMRRGHPWLIAHEFMDAILTLRPPATMRRFLNQHNREIHYVKVESPSIIQDLDTPEDYRRFQCL
jgi:molybdenum cofactor cytidylyltransferase